MTSPPHPHGDPRARRPRRAVRHAGTVGGDDANLVSSHPVQPTAPDTVPTTPPDRTAAPEPAVPTRSADDSDVGWGDREAGSNDDRLHQDKPPHW
ncbi:hypothetical protein [Cellulomonas xylanilytica]|uniref:Uncharacterized protein n=1 Tax=Cellulomonas xylanilytica TaxID=233583 RepID=A0A510V633_9CELL|nr:hypothetical protein [Cellulomonas xylanilytica]GEK21401.1 hypothetical protein CXY01_19210 [Cellulomonas xylanilytica]